MLFVNLKNKCHYVFLYVMLYQDFIYENNFNKDNNLALLKEYRLFNTKKLHPQ